MASPIAKLIAFIKNIFSSLFGSVSWSPPKWINFIWEKIFGSALLLVIAYLRFLEQKPKRFLLTNLLVIATIVGSAYGYRWYINQPKPSTLTLKINTIAATKLDVEKPVPNPLVVEFSGSAATIDKVGKEIKEGIEVSPKLSGTWRWADDSRLEFQPDADWDVGQLYAVKLKKNLFPRHILLEKYSFDFYSPKFTPQVDTGEFYEDPTNPKNKQAVVKIKFTHPVDKSDLEKKINVRMRVEPVKSFDDSDVKKLGFKVVYNESATEAYIRSDLVQIPEKDGEMLVEVAKDLHAACGGSGAENPLSRAIHVPGVENYFKISDVAQGVVTNEANFAAERIITISSTAGVSQSELAKNVELLLLPNDPALYEQGLENEQPESEYEEPSDGDQSEYEEGSEESDESESSEESYTPGLPEGSCPWTSAGQVPDEALKSAKSLKFEWIPNEKEFATENSLKFEADIGRCVFLKIKKGTKSFGDYPLVDNRNFVEVAQPFSQDLKITDKGSILALNGEKKIGVMARGLRAVKYTLFRVLPNSLHHLSTQGYQYDSTYSQPNFNYNFGPENISEVFVSTTTLPAENPGKPQYTVFDFSQYLNANPGAERGLFFLRVTGYDPETKYDSGPQVERLVLVSNLGFIIKDLQDDSHQVYVLSTSLQTPVQAATVEVLGKNGQAIFSGDTDAQGKIDLPSFKDFKFEKTPTVYVVKKEGELSFMPFNRSDRKLNFSRFDIGGLYTEKASESLQAYIFSDRGIYRPGETAQLGLAVKSLNWLALPNNIPFELSILDPRGIEIKKQKVSFPSDGFQEFTFAVPESALTGSYTVQLSIVRPKKDSYLLGSTLIRVEEFMPDRLKITASLSKPITSGWLSPEDLKLDVSLRNLYGTPAEGNSIKSRLKLTPALPSFSGWENFSFFDPFAAKNSFSEDLGEVVTDEEGQATIELGLERFERATYQLSAFTQGIEKEGGRFVAANVSALVSPQAYLLGWKPGGDLSYIKKGFTQKVKLVAIGPDLKSLAVDNLILERVEERYVSVLTKQSSGSLSYQSVKKKIVKDSKNFSIAEGGVELSMPSEEPGTYYYEVRDAHGLVLNTIPFTIVGNANLSSSMERNAELQLKLIKTDFASEEEIEFEVQAPYTGTGLVTIERDKVYAASWFVTTTNSSIQKIKLPKGIEGNAFLNVTFVRSLDSKEIFTSPLSYAVEPFSISKDLRTERINLTVPSEIMPGQTLKIAASSKSPTRAVVYAVDEGILQVARYRTPDPLSHFFRKRALEVQTEQIVDLLLPEYRLVREFSAAGGDEDALLGKHRNPFKRKGQKPVIFWSGIVELNEQAKEFSFNVPDYFNGSVKVFAVSVSEQKVGVTEKQVTIQGNMVISPNAPLFAAPGDEFNVSAVVANTKLPDGNFSVTLQTDSKLQLLSDPTVSLAIASTKDEVANFKVKALSVLGSSDLIFRSSGLDSKGQFSEARYTIDLSVRPAAARLSTISTGVLKSGLLGAKEAVLPLERSLFKEESERHISFSTLPIILVQGLSKYLEEYPHGCTEQITSQAFPTLLFSKDAAFALNPEKATRTMTRAFAQQGARQKEDGSFGFWPGDETQIDWLNLHVGRFLLEAKDRGFSPPKSLLDNSTSYLRTLANSTLPELTIDSARNRAIAIYLLTRTGEVTTNYLQTLREELEASKIKDWKKDLLSLFMASSYKLLQLDKDADDLSKNVKITDSTDDLFLYAKNSKIGLYLDLLSRHFPEKARALEASFFEGIVDQLSNNTYSTVSSANLMLGLEQYQKLFSDSLVAESADILGSADGTNFAPLMIPQGRLPNLNLASDLKALKLIAKTDRNIFYQISQSGFDLPESVKAISSAIEIQREYRNSKNEVITEANLGDDVTVVLSLRAKEGKEYMDNIAVTDLLPTALEISGGTKGLSSDSLELPKHWSPQFVDAREDRALLYGSATSSLQQFSYKTKAVSKGTFIVPPIQAEAMYDPKIRSVAGGGTFIVK